MTAQTPKYVCTNCGNDRCKLWRQYNLPASEIELLCVYCAQSSQGVFLDLPKHGDQIGGLVPAVPHGDTFWGYTSVPEDAAEWWKSLTTYPCRNATVEEAAEITEQARRWAENGGYFKFESYKGLCWAVACEFLANQRGLTLYKDKPNALRRQDDIGIATRHRKVRERGKRT